MSSFSAPALLLELVLGFAIGVVGAISPGPLAVALVHKSQAPRRGMLTHLIVCVAVGLATGPFLRTMATTPSRKTALALAYIAFGALLTARHLLSNRPLGGVGLAIKWILVIGFAAWTGLVGTDLASGVGFACGVWAGVAAWFFGLAALGSRLGARRVDGWLRAFTLVGAGLLIAIGVYGEK